MKPLGTKANPPASTRLAATCPDPLAAASFRWATRHQARRDIAAWTDTWYNPHRLHSANNMTGPNNHEQAKTYEPTLQHTAGSPLLAV